MTKAKERILDTASRLFHQQGYNSTGINEIIAEANIAKSTLYQHFASKDQLCIAFLERRHEQWFTQLRAVVEAKERGQSQLLALFDFVMQMNEKEQYRGCSFLNILSEISVQNQSAILQVIQQHKTDLQNYIKSVTQETHAHLADHIYFLFESAIIESQLYREQAPVLKIKNIVTSLL
ncbi:MAG TPA: TetR family transcriptional regulator [Microscillaceae bacterium]|nr:TetR family transcriptional regulator [Microscillaceae bacterium]